MIDARPALLATVTCIAALFWGSAVQAKSMFPSQIRRQLSLSYEVPCSVCHLKENTGPGTAGTPFALSLRARGLSGKDATSLRSSLARLQADKVDSDGDGTPDVTELVHETDPNSAANANLVSEVDPGYGCGGLPPKGRSPRGAAVVGVCELVWLLRRRRRGRP
ncbi:MAG TPA: thrombospondin type 3 repeat-containing protein [Polyangiales bacterium]